tara:strand:- start:143 stop:1000 length:858 start_codon:yes stop_codon:yes gene_type:complete
MLLKRLGGSILVRDGIAVQSFGFRRHLPVGSPEVSSEFLNRWGIDEICLLDISGNRMQRGPDIEMIRRVAAKAFVPLCYGGGVTSLDQVRQIIAAGADKVLIRSKFIESLFHEVVDSFGAQALVACIDYSSRKSDIASRDGSIISRDEVLDYALRAEKFGVGELLIQSTDRDGLACGLDCDLIAEVSRRVQIPVIAMGGVGRSEHIAECLNMTEASAVVVGNILNHCEHSVMLIKKQLQRMGHDLRSSGRCRYELVPISTEDRLLKRSESYLDDLGFIKVDREVI